MIADSFMRRFQNKASFEVAFLQQKFRKPLVKAFPQNLLHQPHHIRKPRSHNLVRVIGNGCGLQHELFIDIRRNNPKRGIFFRFNADLKLDAVHHAGRGNHKEKHG